MTLRHGIEYAKNGGELVVVTWSAPTRSRLGDRGPHRGPKSDSVPTRST
jgi:hypothetical protein